VARKDGDERELALAEAWFYIGEYEALQSRAGKAREAFEKARATGITHYLEYVAAGLALQQPSAKP